MITNRSLHKIVDVPATLAIMKNQTMLMRIYEGRFGNSLLLYCLPYVIEIKDILTENYLAISLLNLDEGRMIHGGFAIDCCLKLGLQSISELRARHFENHPHLGVFLSWNVQKMRNLETELEALDMLLPMLKVKGLRSMDDGTFSLALKVGIHTSPISKDLKMEYLHFLSNGQD